MPGKDEKILEVEVIWKNEDKELTVIFTAMYKSVVYVEVFDQEEKFAFNKVAKIYPGRSSATYKAKFITKIGTHTLKIRNFHDHQLLASATFENAP
jgi:hypothetical protein